MTEAPVCKCGAAASEADVRRCAAGHLMAGNTAALVTGGRSRQVQGGRLEEQAEAVVALAEEQQALIVDLGGECELTQLERDMVRSYTRLALVEEFCYINIRLQGIFTTTGRQRAVVGTLRQTVAQKSDLARTLGLKRRARNVPQTVGEIVASVKGA